MGWAISWSAAMVYPGCTAIEQRAFLANMQKSHRFATTVGSSKQQRHKPIRGLATTPNPKCLPCKNGYMKTTESRRLRAFLLTFAPL